MTFFVYLGMFLCGMYIVTCEQAPTNTHPPVIEVDTTEADTVKPSCQPWPVCYDPRPPVPPTIRRTVCNTRASPVLDEFVTRAVGPEAAGASTWFDENLPKISLYGNEPHLKAVVSSSHLHHECIKHRAIVTISIEGRGVFIPPSIF